MEEIGQRSGRVLRMEKKVNKKTKILRAATALFATGGVRKTTMDQIAKEASVGKGTIYYYYNDKTEILLDCYMHHIMQIRSNVLNSLVKKENTVLRLKQYLDYISEESRHDAFVSTLFEEYKQDRLPEISVCFQQSESDAVRMVIRLLEEGIAKGELQQVPLPLTAFLLVRMMFAYNLDYEKNNQSEADFLLVLRQWLMKQ